MYVKFNTNLPTVYIFITDGVTFEMKVRSVPQVTTKNDVIAGYGPVVPDGYGCAYNVRKNGFIFSVSAFHSDGRTNAMQFAQTLEQSLRDMAAMIKNSKKS